MDIVDNLTPEKVAQKPQSGCYIYGIFIEGAKWYSHKHIIV